jgi:excisionase family DNA binding protein
MSAPRPGTVPANGALTLSIDIEAVAVAVAAELERRGLFARQETTPYLAIEEAAAYIAAKPQRLYDLVNEGKLTPARDGRRLLFTQAQLDDYVAGGSS